MTKLQKFLKIGLPIAGSVVVASGAVTAIALTTRHTSSINRNLTKLNQEVKEDGITKEIDYIMPSITSKWGQIALVPTYSDTVMEKFGAVYTPYGANTKPWPRLIANNVSADKIKTGNVDKSDLLTFEQLIPNVLLAHLIAEATIDIPSYETVLAWVTNPDNPSEGRWVNRLAEKYHPSTAWNIPDYRSEFNARAAIYSSANNDNDSQTTCKNVDQLLSSLLMNPWIYDSAAYNNGLEFEPAYSHVYSWDLSNNFLTTLPRGMFKYINLKDTNLQKYQVWEQYGFGLILERNNLCVLNPMELFGDWVETNDESWVNRNQWLGSGNDMFKCNVYLNLSKTLINKGQTSWNLYAGQRCENEALVPTAKYGWNFIPVNGDPLPLYIQSDSPNEYYKVVSYTDGMPDIAPVSRYDSGDPLNYGLATDSENLTNIVMTDLTDDFSKADIWASNEVARIVDSTLECIIDLNLISLPQGEGVIAKGSSDDLNGTCRINLNAADISSTTDIETDVDITGFNETKSGLILSICLTVIFLLVLFFAIRKVYRNYHPKLSKDELKNIREINSANRLNRIRRLAEERASKEEATK